MTSLFGSNRQENSSLAKVEQPIAEVATKSVVTCLDTFSDLGLCDWVCKSALSMGFRRPTDIQKACIPAVLEGRDVMGCAETGSGKTAAFALPILQDLSQDPYGIFCVVLTPTRELALQISEQFNALGAPMALRTTVIIGGVSIMDQRVALSRQPHIVVATPGRLRDHIESADPPKLGRCRYLVLDEADRLLSVGFSSELRIIMSKLSPTRRTLLFSATLTDSIDELENIAMSDTLRFNLNNTQRIPAQLKQQYLFIPAQVKMCYLVGLLRKLLEPPEGLLGDDDNSGKKKKKDKKEKKRKFNKNQEDDLIEGLLAQRSSSTSSSSSSTSPISVIIFAGSCKRCQETAEVLLAMGIDCVALHSVMPQGKRIATLGKFKSSVSRILVATDVASRGLDIPNVDVVVNMDLPTVMADYVHRVGRTARAGRAGSSISLVTQYDVDVVHGIEEFTGEKMEKYDDVKEDDILPLLNSVSKAMRSSQLLLLEQGFDDKIAAVNKRRRAQRTKMSDSCAGSSEKGDKK